MNGERERENGRGTVNGKKGAENPTSLFRRGMENLTEGAYRLAVDRLRRAALAGHRRSRIILSALAAGGVGMMPDLEASLEWLRGAGVDLDPERLYHLAKKHQVGEGGEQQELKAACLHSKAARQGYAPAQNNLGAMYVQGQGVEQDFEAALEWFREAASQKNAVAQNNLGAMYAKGRGVEQNDEKAVQWFRRAASQECASAQLNLGLMHARGRGVAQDEEEAIRWIRKAAAQGMDKAHVHLKTLTGE